MKTIIILSILLLAYLFYRWIGKALMAYENDMENVWDEIDTEAIIEEEMSKKLKL